MGQDQTTAETDSGAHDERIDGQLAASPDRAEQMTSDPSDAHARGHHLGVSAAELEVDRFVSASSAESVSR